MRKIKLRNIGSIKTFEEAIAMLPRATIYEGYDENREVDILKVCCWMCEKLLNNGMNVVHKVYSNLLNQNAQDNNQRVSAQISNDDMDTVSEDEETANVLVGIIQNDDDYSAEKCLLVCGDCEAGLEQSLKKLKQLSEKQNFIYDPKHPAQFSEDPLDPENFLFPTSDECDAPFIYTKKTVLVRQISLGENDSPKGDIEASENDDKLVGNQMLTSNTGNEEHANKGTETTNDNEVVLSRTLVNYILVEPNPNLENSVYVRALNTINLFCLNGRSFVPGSNPATIDYINQTPYDDLRLITRKSAYNQARKALNQVKMMKANFVSNELLEVLVQQYQILLELTGFFTVWKQVFNDGGSSDIFNKIAPKTPVPLPNEEANVLKAIRGALPLSAENIKAVIEETYSNYKDRDAEEIELDIYEDIGSELSPIRKIKTRKNRTRRTTQEPSVTRTSKPGTSVIEHPKRKLEDENINEKIEKRRRMQISIENESVIVVVHDLLKTMLLKDNFNDELNEDANMSDTAELKEKIRQIISDMFEGEEEIINSIYNKLMNVGWVVL